MYESPSVPESDGDAAALAEIASGIESVDAALRVAEIAQVRLLARAGQLARKQASGSPASVRLHDMALRSIAAELGGILRIADRTVQRRIDDARTLVEDYPAALAAWEDGRITRGHVRVIVDAGGIVPPGTRERFEAEAVSRCERDTPNRVKAAIEILAERLAERSFTERHRDAADERCVRVVCGRDGMSDVVATVPTVIADGILDRLTQQAQVIIDAREKGDGDTRRTDQVRADVFSDLLLAGTPALDAPGEVAGALGAVRAQVQVIVPALTLLGVVDGPADLVGCSPIDADTARCLARNATSWTRVLTDPVDGHDRGRRPVPRAVAAAPLPARPRPALPIPRMPQTCDPLRDRSHRRCRARRPHHPLQPRPLVPTSSLDEAVHTLECRTTLPRSARLDLTHGARLPRRRTRTSRVVHGRHTRSISHRTAAVLSAAPPGPAPLRPHRTAPCRVAAWQGSDARRRSRDSPPSAEPRRLIPCASPTSSRPTRPPPTERSPSPASTNRPP